MLEEFKPRVLENYAFEYEQNNDNNGTFRHFRPIMKIMLLAQESEKFNPNTFYT